MHNTVEFFLLVLLALTGQVAYGFQNPSVTHYGSLDGAAVKTLFEDFTYEYDKVYLSSGEEEKRFKIFTENLKRYDEMNRLDMGTAVYGIDQFSDMTVQEFRDQMLTLDARGIREGTGKFYEGLELDNVKIPKNFDWRKKGAVTPVKNQGSCGSCWAFSACGNMEGLYFIKHNELIIFSEQQIVDCDKTSYACNGGWMENAVNYVKGAGGLQTNATYPYVGHEQVCAFDKSKVVLKVKENVMLPVKNEKKMAQYLFKKGPISVALDASAMMGYKGGIAHPQEPMCSKNETQVNHGITMVGFGVKIINRKKKLPFWIAKNSWSERWGAKGYYYLYRGDGSCAIDTYPSSAVLA